MAGWDLEACLGSPNKALLIHSSPEFLLCRKWPGLCKSPKSLSPPLVSTPLSSLCPHLALLPCTLTLQAISFISHIHHSAPCSAFTQSGRCPENHVRLLIPPPPGRPLWLLQPKQHFTGSTDRLIDQLCLPLLCPLWKGPLLHL